ncbi:hypothetical protein PR202_gb21254 [Eleusine coracana subsp. coracana]|uniref:Transmembrane protein n=1 Tax=Eleusine coracana subsp. coracana TaxID=191504 RepID=A0AAV5FEN7_ELECO|nr:hypothetical protein PR202_gb21254 [Eleusine coracana subsp. coracana]
MAKNRNKKNKAKTGGGPAAMDTSEGAPVASSAAESTQPMDTSEGNRPSSASAALSSINRFNFHMTFVMDSASICVTVLVMIFVYVL